MKLFEENDIFKILSEAISEGILIVNDKQEIVASNSVANKMFRYQGEDLNGKLLEVLLPRKATKKHGNYFKAFMQKGERRSMGQGLDLRGIRKDGSEFPLEIGLNPFKLLRKKYVMALVVDISERKKAEQLIGHWFTVFNESLNEIYVFNVESYRLLNVNRGAELNLGYTLEELNGMSVLDIKPKLTSESFGRLLRPLINGKKDKIEFETVHGRKDGSTYPVEVHLQLSQLEKEQVGVAIVLDITERKSYTEKLERTVEERTLQLSSALEKEKSLNELKTKFLSLVSHEFKTPLTSILTSITLLSKYTEANQQDKRDKHINTIKSKVKYLDNILSDFLSIERLESGQVRYNHTTFPLSKVINEVVYGANSLLKEGQHIIYPQNIDDIIVTFDEKILALSLTNLINNAIKYSTENSTVEILAEQKKEYLAITVSDQGIGIPEDEQPYVFDRYFRASNVLTTQGTGIGLNIAKQHMANLDADIFFESSEEKGTTFTIQIPTKPKRNEKDTIG